MAQARVSFVPSFVNYAIAIGEKKPVVEAGVTAFNTSRTGKDRTSKAVTIEAMHYDEATKSIKVFCSDGNLRECRTARLPDLEVGRQLWRKLQKAGKEKQEVSFVAAGGLSPDKWFYSVL